MPSSKTEQTTRSGKAPRKKKDRAAEIADTFEWLITAFILAFVFRAFVMEAFRIPTGSMADTLMGAHFRLCCPQCGYRYNYGFDPRQYSDRNGRRLREDTVPSTAVKPPRTRCPSCGHFPSRGEAVPVANGDRILVLKCIYQFFEPNRWDVIVFKNPNEPHINYIKRLVALPGDELEIIDGDVYIDGQVSRKPARVQSELWMPVYDNDYQPVNPLEPSFNGHQWRVPFDMSNSQWAVDEANPTMFRLDSAANQLNTMVYDTSLGNGFRAAYAYNHVAELHDKPYCSDLMVRFYAKWGTEQGIVGVSLGKYGIDYKAWVDPAAGTAAISKVSGGAETTLVSESVSSAAANGWALVRFANVDHRLILDFGRETVAYDLGLDPQDAGPRRADIEPRAEIFGSGQLALSHVGIFRDTHYTSKRSIHSTEQGEGTEGKPFLLEEDEFFVLGDNSPNSQDSRWWESPGEANNGLYYRAGIVPRDYLVGKALFVYWPSGFKPFAKFPVAAIPNVGRMRFIYGGSDSIE